MADITVLKASIEKEQALLKLWNKFFRNEATRARNEITFRDSFSKQNMKMFQGFDGYRRSCEEYDELITAQIVKEIQQFSDDCSKLLAKANELVRRAPDANTKAATDKEVGELKKRLDEFEAAKERMVKENVYLSLNYKLEVLCRGAEAESAILQQLTIPTAEETLKGIFG